MTKQLFLCLAACTLVFAPGCSKKAPTYRKTIQIVPYYEEKVEILQPEQLEKDRKKHKTRGIALTATAPVVIAGGAAGSYLGAFACGMGRFGPPAWLVGVTASAIVIFGGGVYMLGQGIHDLAKAKKLRRIQMKDAAQKRKAEREKCLPAA